jgi:hypothetical protein
LFPPDLLPGASSYVEALDALATSRPLALGFGGMLYARIPFLALDRYASRVLLIEDATEFARFYKIMATIDGEEVAAINAKLNKKQT